MIIIRMQPHIKKFTVFWNGKVQQNSSNLQYQPWSPTLRVMQLWSCIKLQLECLYYIVWFPTKTHDTQPCGNQNKSMVIHWYTICTVVNQQNNKQTFICNKLTNCVFFPTPIGCFKHFCPVFCCQKLSQCITSGGPVSAALLVTSWRGPVRNRTG